MIRGDILYLCFLWFMGVFLLYIVWLGIDKNQKQIITTLQTIQIQTGVDYAQDVEKIKTELPERGKE